MVAVSLATCLANRNTNYKLQCVKHMYLYSTSNQRRDCQCIPCYALD